MKSHQKVQLTSARGRYTIYNGQTNQVFESATTSAWKTQTTSAESRTNSKMVWSW